MVMWKVTCLNGFNMCQQMALAFHREKECYIAVSEPRRCPN